jgi:hypothetical protein
MKSVTPIAAGTHTTYSNVAATPQVGPIKKEVVVPLAAGTATVNTTQHAIASITEANQSHQNSPISMGSHTMSMAMGVIPAVNKGVADSIEMISAGTSTVMSSQAVSNIISAASDALINNPVSSGVHTIISSMATSAVVSTGKGQTYPAIASGTKGSMALMAASDSVTTADTATAAGPVIDMGIFTLFGAFGAIRNVTGAGSQGRPGQDGERGQDGALTQHGYNGGIGGDGLPGNPAGNGGVGGRGGDGGASDGISAGGNGGKGGTGGKAGIDAADFSKNGVAGKGGRGGNGGASAPKVGGVPDINGVVPMIRGGNGGDGGDGAPVFVDPRNPTAPVNGNPGGDGGDAGSGGVPGKAGKGSPGINGGLNGVDGLPGKEGPPFNEGSPPQGFYYEFSDYFAADTEDLANKITATRPRIYVGSTAIANRIANMLFVGPMRPAPHYVVKRVGNSFTQVFFTPEEIADSPVIPQEAPLNMIAPVHADINNVDSMLAEWDLKPSSAESKRRDEEWEEAGKQVPIMMDGVSYVSPHYGISNAAILSHMYYNNFAAIGQNGGDTSMASTAARAKVFADRVKHGTGTKFVSSPLAEAPPSFLTRLFGKTKPFPTTTTPGNVPDTFIDKIKTPATMVPDVDPDQKTWLESLLATVTS